MCIYPKTNNITKKKEKSQLNPNVLIIDDDITCCKFIKKFLNMNNVFNTSIKTTGKTASEFLEKNMDSTQLIIIDYYLQDSNALQIINVINNLAKQKKKVSIPKIVFISGSYLPKTAKNITLENQLTFIKKPIKNNEIRTILRNKNLNKKIILPRNVPNYLNIITKDFLTKLYNLSYKFPRNIIEKINKLSRKKMKKGSISYKNEKKSIQKGGASADDCLNSREQCLAFAMAQHNRLGSESPAKILTRNVVQHICTYLGLSQTEYTIEQLDKIIDTFKSMGKIKQGRIKENEIDKILYNPHNPKEIWDFSGINKRTKYCYSTYIQKIEKAASAKQKIAILTKQKEELNNDDKTELFKLNKDIPNDIEKDFFYFNYNNALQNIKNIFVNIFENILMCENKKEKDKLFSHFYYIDMEFGSIIDKELFLADLPLFWLFFPMGLDLDDYQDGAVRAVKLLIEKCGINQLDKDGNTIIHYFAKILDDIGNDTLKNLESLIIMNPDIDLNIQNKEEQWIDKNGKLMFEGGDTPLHIATKKLVKMLKNNPKEKILFQKQLDDYYWFHFISQYQPNDLYKFLRQRDKLIKGNVYNSFYRFFDIIINNREYQVKRGIVELDKNINIRIKNKNEKTSMDILIDFLQK